MRRWGVGLVLLCACTDFFPGSSIDAGTRDAGAGDASFREDVAPDGPDAAGPDLYPGSPPPMQGGTLQVSRAGAFVLAADPDRDRVWVMDWARRAVRAVMLPEDVEPGRMAEDASGLFHVALRRGGAVATIDPRTATLVSTSDVCSAPSGIAYRESDDRLLVACAHGELVVLEPSGDVVSRVELSPDLRDVVVQGDRVFVSTFRGAEVIVLDADVVSERFRPVDATVRNAEGDGVDLVPLVAYRLVATRSGVLALHQRASSSAIDVERPGAYSGGMECQAGIVHGSVTRFDGDSEPGAGPALGGMALPVDVAISPDGTRFAVANGAAFPRFSTQVGIQPLAALDRATAADCLPIGGAIRVEGPSQVSALAFHPSGALIVQFREPGLLRVLDFPGESGDFQDVLLPGALSVYDPGHALFHQQTGSATACASCHPGAHEDGHTWELGTTGPRRTQSLLGGLLDTAPFHWSGDQPDLGAIMNVTFTERMSGGTLSPHQIDELGVWLDAQPAPPALPADPRGAEVFASSGCVDCHGGEIPSMESVDVGTGGRFQVPPLSGVAHRAPYFHDGCAATLEATLDGSCASDHAVALPEADRDSLLHHLRSL